MTSTTSMSSSSSITSTIVFRIKKKTRSQIGIRAGISTTQRKVWSRRRRRSLRRTEKKRP